MIKDMTKGTPWKLKSLWYLTPMALMSGVSDTIN